MKQITTSLLIALLGFLGLTNQVKAQPDAILVPTYQNQSEMPAKIKPEQKLLKQLPLVIINENGVDLSLFKGEMNVWIEKNPSILKQLEKSIRDLISANQFNELAEILIEMEHSRELSSINYKGGKHE
jgi:hypothetical protein